MPPNGSGRRRSRGAFLCEGNRESADQIVQAAWFNPDIAAYLLERPLKNQNATFNNVPLRRLIAAANASRESGNE
jgi:hypothetical protein